MTEHKQGFLDYLESHQSETPSRWREEAEWRRKHKKSRIKQVREYLKKKHDMEEYTKTELKKKIEVAEEMINNLDLQIEDLKKQRSAIQDEKRDYVRHLNKLEADEFRQSHGKDKPFEEIRSMDLPEDLSAELYDIRSQIRGGCYGDPLDGCRGCDKNCEGKARRQFEEKYNIKFI